MAVAGLGRMGRAFARRLTLGDRPLVVANRTAARAEAFAAEHDARAVPLAEVFQHAPICVTSVVDSDALEEIAGSLLDRPVPPGRVLIDMSTVAVAASSRVAAAAAERGVGYLRAPVAGNPAVVDSGKLAILASGDAATFDECVDVLEQIGPRVFLLGDGEQARVMKLALNLMLAGTTQLLAEAVVLAEANGLPRRGALDVIANTVIGSPFVQMKAPALAARDYTATATTSLITKDLDLALDLGASSGVPLPTTELVDRLLHETVELGHGEDDFMALVLRLEHDAGVSSS